MAKALGFLSFVAFFVLFTLSNVHGLISPLEEWPQEKRASFLSVSLVDKTGNSSLFIEGIDNNRDLVYATFIALNGRQIPVLIDTGSTDTWVNITGFNNFMDTRIPLRLRYIGGTIVSGTIGFATFQMGSISIEQQAFLHVTNSKNASLIPFGLYGILGLSFDAVTASPINAAFEAIYGTDSTLGYSVLRRYFIEHPQLPKVVALRLTRSDDPDDKTGGSMAIGEYDPRFLAVTGTPKLPQFPIYGDRWTTLLGGIYVDGEFISVTSNVPGAPTGHASALLDSGTSRAIFPVAVWDAIYSRIPGTAKYKGPKNSIWIVPCKATTIVEIVFDGRKYAIHPLELTLVSTVKLSQTLTVTYCASAFRGIDDIGGSQFDIILGDSFLRNVYSAFNFGDSSSKEKPYIQLLSTVDVKKAVDQVTTIRGKQLAQLPPELPPAELIKHLPH